eukprot:Phypoly_transcript_07791.p1 GENE.Phypoly_transcript_07791~~Phypoly_transcript_07791.p1  ORF type:complete len:316 (+),score=78.64 Phypoly_transcript_07791:574-1521(+)
MSNISPVERFQNEDLIHFLENKWAPLLSSSPSISLLEVGCGTGALAAILQEKYKDKIKYTAIDPNAEAISKAKARGVQGAEACRLEDFKAENGLFDVVLFTVSFHHFPLQKEAAEIAHRLLKPGGLFIAEEFGRNLMDLPTATFLFPKMDALEDAGKLPSTAMWWHAIPEGKKEDYLFRWNSKFLQERPKSTPSDTHAAPEHAPIAHAPSAHAPAAHAPADSHAPPSAHASPAAHHGMGPHHYIPTSVEMESDIKSVFPNLEITLNSYFYRLICQRFDNSNDGEAVVRQFKKEEDEAVAKKEVSPLGVIFCAKKI